MVVYLLHFHVFNMVNVVPHILQANDIIVNDIESNYLKKKIETMEKGVETILSRTVQVSMIFCIYFLVFGNSTHTHEQLEGSERQRQTHKRHQSKDSVKEFG